MWKESTVKIDLKIPMVKLEEDGKGGWIKGNVCHLYGDKCPEASKGVRWKGTLSDKCHKGSRRCWMKGNMVVGRMG